MSEYKGIKGFQVQTRTEDPVPYAQALADNPYAGAWGSGGTMNTARRYLGGCGIQTAALGIAGYVGGGTPGYRALVEQYDGTSWTESGDLGQTAGEGRGNSQSIASGMAKLDNPGKSQTEEWTFEHAFKKVTTS